MHSARSIQRLRLNRRPLRIPHDFKDRNTAVGPKTYYRGAYAHRNPDYRVMADGSIRRAA